MKKSKILSFLTAATIAFSAFSALVVTANAAANPVNDGLKFTVEYAGKDEDQYDVFNFNLEDTNGVLTAVTGSKKYSGNALDGIQIVADFDSTVFDTSEIYLTATPSIVAGNIVTTADGVSPIKYSYSNTSPLTYVSTLPNDFLVSIAVLPLDSNATEEEMLAGITLADNCFYRVQYFDGSSKDPTYTTLYRLDNLGDYQATAQIGSAAPAATITGVTISPTSATVNGGESQTFTATVSGTGAYDSTVTYSATAGTITSAGVFTAPAATDESQTITVTATSNGDNTKSATATVTVPAAAPVVPTPTATVDERGVVKGNDAADGQNTAVTKLGFANTVDPFVRITLGGDHKDYELPAGVKGGTASLIAILRYAKGTVGTFTIAVMDGGSTLIETTHVATDE